MGFTSSLAWSSDLSTVTALVAVAVRPSWGAAHGPLWEALRKKGKQVRVLGIAVENATVDRTARVLEAWAAADPGTNHEG